MLDEIFVGHVLLNEHKRSCTIHIKSPFAKDKGRLAAFRYAPPQNRTSTEITSLG